MKLLILLFPFFAHAGLLCPPDVCNPFNGCIEGCTEEQKTCNQYSVNDCVGQTWGTICPKLVGNTVRHGTCQADRVLAEPYPCGCY